MTAKPSREEYEIMAMRSGMRSGLTPAAAADFARKAADHLYDRVTIPQIQGYMRYLRDYICELANRTDIPVIPSTFEDWLRSPVGGVTMPPDAAEPLDDRNMIP